MTWIVLRGFKSGTAPEDLTGPFDSKEAAQEWAASNTEPEDASIVVDTSDVRFTSPFKFTDGVLVTVKFPA